MIVKVIETSSIQNNLICLQGATQWINKSAKHWKSFGPRYKVSVLIQLKAWDTNPLNYSITSCQKKFQHFSMRPTKTVSEWSCLPVSVSGIHHVCPEVYCQRGELQNTLKRPKLGNTSTESLWNVSLKIR